MKYWDKASSVSILHYGGPIDTGLKWSLCGKPMGNGSSATYRRYELTDPENLPADCEPCPVCRDALAIELAKQWAEERGFLLDFLGNASLKCADLMSRGDWEGVEELAKKAAEAQRRLVDVFGPEPKP